MSESVETEAEIDERRTQRNRGVAHAAPVKEWSEADVRQFASQILDLLRSAREPVPALGDDQRTSADAAETVDDESLPGWFHAAHVRAGWIGPTLVLVFEDAPDPRGADTSNIYGPVKADTAVFLDWPSLEPVGWPYVLGPIRNRTFAGSLRGKAEPVVIGLADRSGFFNTAGFPNHGPTALFWMHFQMHSGEPTPTSPPALIRLIPACLYVSLADDVDDLNATARWFADELLAQAITFARSSAGEKQRQIRTMRSSLAISVERSVIVLGSYASSEAGEGDELVRVRDYLIRLGYAASLIREFADVPQMSVTAKVRMWTAAARFCVMVDRNPSGHIAEYEMLRTQNTILALLRPSGRGSTRMIGDDHLVDVNYIKEFSFALSPIEKVDEAVSWAEDFIRKRTEALKKLSADP